MKDRFQRITGYHLALLLHLGISAQFFGTQSEISTRCGEVRSGQMHKSPRFGQIKLCSSRLGYC